MSLLQMGSMSLEDDDDIEELESAGQTVDYAGDHDFADAINDGFGDDADDDDLSFDGIYDEDEAQLMPANASFDDLPVSSSKEYGPPPTYEAAGPSTYAAYSAQPRGLVAPAMPAGPSRIAPSQSSPTQTYYPGIDVCIVCQKRPPYSKNGKSYPTCGMTCANIFKHVLDNTDPLPSTVGRGRGGGGGGSGFVTPARQAPSMQPSQDEQQNMSRLLQHLGHKNGAAGSPSPKPSPPLVFAASTPAQQQPIGFGGSPTSPRQRAPPFLGGQMRGGAPSGPGGSNGPPTRYGPPRPPRQPLPVTNPCVVCKKRNCYDRYPTCGLRCAEKLAKGGADPTLCDYCHKKPKLAGHNQCGNQCKDAAKLACLLCKSRPKFKRYHLCGKTCKQLSAKQTPLILEAPEGHATWMMVQNKFDSAWKYGTKPQIKKIYKIIESRNFLMPYDKYKKKVGNEAFRYHGTSRKCTLGSNGNVMLCNDSTCALCCILKTSFKTSLANPHGAFGPGIYTSSAANKAHSYSNHGNGALLLTKVVLGQVHNVTQFGEVSSCPSGKHSVVFDRNAGALNETIIYSDDAIRPVFMIIFK